MHCMLMCDKKKVVGEFYDIFERWEGCVTANKLIRF